MPASPRVSVITATYNWSSVLRYAIESVLWQEFQDFEMLVIGDGCTDDSASIVASFGDRRLHWHNLPENSGSQSTPNNAGIEQARGEYIAYLGHDDLWLPQHLARLIEACDRERADVAYSLLELIGPPGTEFRALTGFSESGTYEFGMLVPPSSVMHRRDIVREIGGWRDYRTIVEPPDREFLNRAWAAGKRFVSVPAMTVCKFPSAWRRNSYRERRSDEQAIYVRRMRTEPTFVTDELLAVLASYVLERRLPILHAPVPADPPPGWYVQQSRAVRGLEPVDATVPETGVASTGTNATNSESVKASELRPERYIRSLERALGEKDRQFTELETYVRSLEARLAAHHEARAEAERYAASLRQALKEQGQRFREVESYAQSLQEHAAAVEQARGKTETYARSLQRLVDEQEHRLAAAAAAARPVERDAGHECMGESSAPPSDATATAMGQDDPSHRHGT